MRPFSKRMHMRRFFSGMAKAALAIWDKPLHMRGLPGASGAAPR